MATKTPKLEDVVIGSNIRRLRMLLGMSQETLGNRLNLTFQQVQKYEKGTNRVGGSRMSEIAKIFGVRVDVLFKGIPNDATEAVALMNDPFIELHNSGWGIDLARAVIKMPPKVRKAMIELCRAVSETRNSATEVTDGHGQEVN